MQEKRAKKASNTNFWWILCRNVKGERGRGLLAVRNVSCCIMLACGEGPRKCWERMTNTPFLWNASLSQGPFHFRVRREQKYKAVWRELWSHVAQPLHFDDTTPETCRAASLQHGSTMGERCSPSKEQTHGAEIVSMLWLLRCFRQTLNLREEFLCFQSLNDFSSLGYWPKGTEKCNVDSKLPIKKKNIAALSLWGLGGFTKVHDWTFSSEKWG